MEVTVYKVFDNKEFCFYGDQDDIVAWLTDNQIQQLDISVEQLNKNGWVWGLEQCGVTFEEVYSKEFNNQNN